MTGGTTAAAGWRRWAPGSGPAVASLFHRLFGLISLAAWWSLGSQVRVLIGSHGLLPAADFMDAVRAAGVSPFEVPTLFRALLFRGSGDAVLVGGTVVGAALSIAALAGWRPRICFAISTALYLSYATVSREFLSFQWDNLLLECGLLAAFLPANARRAAGPFPVPGAAVQAVLRVGRREVAVADPRLAGRQRDDVLLRDGAAADVGGGRRAPPAGLVAPLREPRRAGAGADRAAVHLWPASVAAGCRGRVRDLPDRQRGDRELRDLLLPVGGVGRVPAGRRRRPVGRAPPPIRDGGAATRATRRDSAGPGARARRSTCWCRRSRRWCCSRSRGAASRSWRRSSS